jgi:hypothetical protein
MASTTSSKDSEAKTPPAKWRLSEDWLATVFGLVVIVLVRLGDLTVKWPLFEWFKK